MNIFTQEALILPSFQKKIGALRRIRFQKHPLFTIFSLFLKVNEVCKRFLYKTLYTLPFFKKKALHHRTFQKHPLFTTFLIIFTVDEVCYTSNKYQPPNNLAKYQYFYTRKFISLPSFWKKIALSIANIFRNIYFLLHFHYFNSELSL